MITRDRCEYPSNRAPGPISGGVGARILGPRNVSLERENPALLASPSTDADVAFTARGRALVVQEQMEIAPDFAAAALDVEHIDDYRQAAEAVESGVGVRWTDEEAQRALRDRIVALRELARGET